VAIAVRTVFAADAWHLAGFMVLFGVEKPRSTIASDSCGSQCSKRTAFTAEGVLPGLRDDRRFVPARDKGPSGW
jgi:hypothetical protein